MYVCFVSFFSQSWDNRLGLLDLKQSINQSIWQSNKRQSHAEIPPLGIYTWQFGSDNGIVLLFCEKEEVSLAPYSFLNYCTDRRFPLDIYSHFFYMYLTLYTIHSCNPCVFFLLNIVCFCSLFFIPSFEEWSFLSIYTYIYKVSIVLFVI